MRDFYEQALIKYERGAKEHGDWMSLSFLEVLEQIQEEFLDIYNYSHHNQLRDLDRMPEIRKFAEVMWRHLESYRENHELKK